MPTYQFEATAYVPPAQPSGQSAHLSAPPFASTASTSSNASSSSASASPAFSSSTASFTPSASQPLTTAALDSSTRASSTRVLVTGRISPSKDKRNGSRASRSSKPQHSHASTSNDGGDKQQAAHSHRTADWQLDELDSVAALEELWNAYQQEKSRAASYHSALEALTLKHTQLQAAHSSTLSAVDTLQQHATQHSHTVQQLQQTVQQLQADKQSLKANHSRYRSDVYEQIEQLKRDFIATQHNYDTTLAYYKRGSEGRQHELETMKQKLATYRQQMAGKDGTRRRAAAKGAVEGGEEGKETRYGEEEKESLAEDGESVIDFRAEVEIVSSGKVPLDSRIKQLTLGKESVGRGKRSGNSQRFTASHSTDSCSDCEQEI